MDGSGVGHPLSTHGGRDDHLSSHNLNTNRGANTTAVDTRVAERIRHARLRAGMSQTQLGRALGLSLQQIHKYETARNRIGPARLLAVCQVLGVGVDSLFREDGGTGGAASAHNAEAMALVQCFQYLGKRERSAVIGLMRALAASYPVVEDDESDSPTHPV